MPFRSRCVVSIVALLLAPYAVAQDGTHGQGHAESHDWYQELKQPGTGYSCCNGTPPRVVLKSLAADGNSHICAGKSGMIDCFIGGSPKS